MLLEHQCNSSLSSCPRLPPHPHPSPKYTRTDSGANSYFLPQPPSPLSACPLPPVCLEKLTATGAGILCALYARAHHVGQCHDEAALSPPGADEPPPKPQQFQHPLHGPCFGAAARAGLAAGPGGERTHSLRGRVPHATDRGHHLGAAPGPVRPAGYRLPALLHLLPGSGPLLEAGHHLLQATLLHLLPQHVCQRLPAQRHQPGPLPAGGTACVGAEPPHRGCCPQGLPGALGPGRDQHRALLRVPGHHPAAGRARHVLLQRAASEPWAGPQRHVRLAPDGPGRQQVPAGLRRAAGHHRLEPLGCERAVAPPRPPAVQPLRALGGGRGGGLCALLGPLPRVQRDGGAGAREPVAAAARVARAALRHQPGLHQQRDQPAALRVHLPRRAAQAAALAAERAGECAGGRQRPDRRGQ